MEGHLDERAGLLSHGGAEAELDLRQRDGGGGGDGVEVQGRGMVQRVEDVRQRERGLLRRGVRRRHRELRRRRLHLHANITRSPTAPALCDTRDPRQRSP